MAGGTAQPPAPSQPLSAVPPGSSTKPWPFSAELLAQQLAAGGFILKPVIDSLMAEASATGRSLPDLLLERKQLTPEGLRDAMSRIFGLPVADLQRLAIDPVLIANFPAEDARRNLFLPLHREGTRLLMVVHDPTPAEAIRAVRRTLGLTIDLRLATAHDLAPLVHQYFSAKLVVLLPSGETIDFPLPSGETKIGKADHNELVLPDPTVSATHAVIRVHGDDYQIVDFGSRNGIFVDGSRVNQSQPLRNGDVIQIGQCLLTFKLPVPDAAHDDVGGTQILMPGQIRTPLRGVAPVRANVPIVPPIGPAPVAAAVAVPPLEETAGESKEKKKKKKKEKDEKLKSAWIGFIGRILAQIVGAIATIILGLAVAGKLPTSCGTVGGNAAALEPPPGTKIVMPIAFGEQNARTKMEYNASGIVPIADSRFIFVENNTNDALFELTLNPDGSKKGPLVARPLRGLAPDSVDDMEALTIAEENGQRYLFAVTSLMTRIKRKVNETPPSGLVRITVRADGGLDAENMADFRAWLIKNSSDVGSSSTLEPEEGGLNIEGLGWDPARHALLLGVRTPVQGGKPLVIPVRVKDLAGPWTTSNLELLPAIHLKIETLQQEQGIRAIQYDPSRKAFLVIVGNSTGGPLGSSAPFMLYLWDGNDVGTVRRVEGLWFDSKMKPEGIAHATVGDKGAVVIVDDAGGFQVLFDDDPRLR
jgi:pSer/pThr/pTyr-binding forkhead associated (FHA) protein